MRSKGAPSRTGSQLRPNCRAPISITYCPLGLRATVVWLSETDTSSVFVAGRDVTLDGVTGELTGLEAVDIERGALGTAGDIFVPIPDDGTGAGAALALPGQRLHWPA